MFLVWCVVCGCNGHMDTLLKSVFYSTCEHKWKKKLILNSSLRHESFVLRPERVDAPVWFCLRFSLPHGGKGPYVLLASVKLLHMYIKMNTTNYKNTQVCSVHRYRASFTGSIPCTEMSEPVRISWVRIKTHPQEMKKQPELTPHWAKH